MADTGPVVLVRIPIRDGCYLHLNPQAVVAVVEQKGYPIVIHAAGTDCAWTVQPPIDQVLALLGSGAQNSTDGELL